MVIAVGGHVYSLPANIAEITGLAVLYGLVVAFIPRSLFYLLDIGHFKL